MGRRRDTKNLHLPKGMRAMLKAGGVLWYYFDKGMQPDGSRPLLPLGKDLAEALRQYADRIDGRAKAPPVTVPELLSRWNVETITGRAKGTTDDIRWSLKPLTAFFSDPAPAPIAFVRPAHIRRYLDWRGKHPTSANREVAWLSAAWNWARDRGITDLPNPCAGVRKFPKTSRDMYIEDGEYAAIEAHACVTLKEAMELAYLIGQRPCDLRAMRETDIKDGCIHLKQSKTKSLLSVEITGELAALLDRIKARKASIQGVRSLSLLTDEAGQPMTKAKLRGRFEKAREAAAEAACNEEVAARLRAIQFRDFRAKAATDVRAASGLDAAQGLLGHTRSATTEIYTRQRKGAKVKPVK